VRKKFENNFENIIFSSRWLQAPMYGGLIIGLLMYVYKFMIELYHMYNHIGESDAAFMMRLLTLVDITMVGNLIVMVIIGGYSTFVSKIRRHSQKDKPQWIDKMNAGVLKVKLGASLIGVSTIHLLQSSVNLGNVSDKVIIWQIAIILVFTISTIGLAYIDKLTYPGGAKESESNSGGVLDFDNSNDKTIEK